jgi:hypothetical protein
MRSEEIKIDSYDCNLSSYAVTAPIRLVFLKASFSGPANVAAIGLVAGSCNCEPLLHRWNWIEIDPTWLASMEDVAASVSSCSNTKDNVISKRDLSETSCQANRCCKLEFSLLARRYSNSLERAG